MTNNDFKKLGLLGFNDFVFQSILIQSLQCSVASILMPLCHGFNENEPLKWYV